MIANGVPWELMLAIVVVLAAVQSIFGVGLLLFGTPTLLTLGVGFSSVLEYLLPCSLAISVLQVMTSGGPTLEPIRRKFLVFTAPAVVGGTVLAVFFSSPGRISLGVGTVLLLTAALRVSAFGQRWVTAYVRSHLRGLLVALGLVHGLSNLGGGVLAAVTGSLFDDKVSVRRHIAFCYGLMAALQLAVVMFDGVEVDAVLVVGLPVVAATVYLVVGQWLFLRVTRAAYQHALTSLLVAFGVLMVTR